MEKEILRKVQLVQLEIAKEIRRVCDENDIKYFLAAGSFLGAVRHKGFIPWDDDMDISMLRADYEKFCRIAPEKLGEKYCFQNWDFDPNYALPFGKVLKKNTLYLENKKSRKLKENGFYVDIFPLDGTPEEGGAREELEHKLVAIYRMKLMKSGYTPWKENEKTIWKKRIGYLYYQLRSLFVSQKELGRSYDALAVSIPEGKWVVEQYNGAQKPMFQREWFEETALYEFEGEQFAGPKDYDAYLTAAYGDYMTLPPEGERENRHQIVEVDFGED